MKAIKGHTIHGLLIAHEFVSLFHKRTFLDWRTMESKPSFQLVVITALIGADIPHAGWQNQPAG